MCFALEDHPDFLQLAPQFLPLGLQVAHTSQIPISVLMTLNQGTNDPLQDSECNELDCHACRLFPTMHWGHATDGSLPSVQPNLDSTLTAGNVSQLICFSDGSNKNNGPPSDTTQGNDP